MSTEENQQYEAYPESMPSLQENLKAGDIVFSFDYGLAR